MWSDQPSPQHLQELIMKLQSVLPEASPSTAVATSVKLSATPTVEQLAESLRDEPGFTFLNGGPHGPSLMSKPLATITYSSRSARVMGPSGSIEIATAGFDLLHAAVEAWGHAPGALLAGFISYDLSAEIEELGKMPPDDVGFPQLFFGLYDSYFIQEGDGWLLSQTDAWRSPQISVADAEALLKAALAREPRPAGSGVVGSLTSTPDQLAFEKSVNNIVATIQAGDIFQTNLCRSLETTIEANSEWSLFQNLRTINPARYEAFISLPTQNAPQTLLSISPEMFLKVRATDQGSQVESSPIKGTRARGLTDEEDRKLSTELLSSEKDRAELAMIVDVVRNDLARVCEVGSVKVAQHAELMSLPTVHHSFSTVTGRLHGNTGPVDLLRATFPPASISGAPKIEAMRVAMREEGQLRGPCMGAIGWISLNKMELEFAVAIRTAFVTDGRVRYYAGCGITADSVAHDEFIESSHKAAAFVRALGQNTEPI
jgi:para-aminobenzoate synthetase component 1